MPTPVERVERTRKDKGDALPTAVAYCLLQKFSEATQLYIRGKRKGPRFKKQQDSVSLQAQITVTTVASIPVAANKASGKSTINLGRIGGPVCEHVPLVYHRPIPGTAKIKQVAITLRGERVFVVLMIEAPASELTRTFPPAGGRVAGIDQGRKIALSLSTPDGAIRKQFQPPLSRDSGFLRRSSRLERKADRQLRAGNPDLFR